ncbi:MULTISPECIES: DNA polymerase I [unclassified Paenibacillus]|uniref:DNA polymerase I n=1 Tax=unclassified Paenibacillus TaxID=185978 RepID=UPI0009572872|nr:MULTISPECIES: DNA polymerase I [unclassified Paenibacillus]ASS64758.1 DNA polymerase I [Paenibacillus sp. RUD330]SIR07232.1 DNA polymerase I [Paenibacillus sp. RU4X]SIR28486.1 DNA polymerase I [Paenibacillus sp. RU4T]
MDKWILIDGNSIANRAFYAMPPLTNAAGLHTNAVYGFTTMLLKVLEEEKPTHVLVAFDAGKVTFRTESFAEYKGTRQKTPSELSEQFPLIKEVVAAFGIKQFELSGYEADDIIGTMTRLADEKGVKTIVVSGDKDMLQLASEQVTIAVTRKGVSETELYDPAAVKERYGLVPSQIIDLKGLMGDSSDNIPGIPGVGEKTALKLLHEYGTVEAVLEHSGELKGKLKERVEENREAALMSKQLATIFREVPLEEGTADFPYSGFEPSVLADVFGRLEFRSLMERLDLSAGAGGETADAAPSRELTVVPVEIGDSAARSALEAALDGSGGFFLESHGDNPHHADILGAAYAVEDRVFVMDADWLRSEDADGFKGWLADPSRPKTGCDLHRAELVLNRIGVHLQGAGFDIVLAAYLLDPTDTDQSVTGIAARSGLPSVPSDESVYGKGAKFKVPDKETLYAHLAAKAEAVRGLAPLQRGKLEQSGMNRLYFELEQPLSGVLADMEKLGICADAGAIRELGQELEKGISADVAEIYRLAGTEFNINSPKQLGEILFDRLGLPVMKKTKTGYSTDADVLEKLEPYHEIIPLILHFRQLHKLQSTYVEGLLKEIREDSGKIHTYYRQTIAATGRLSSQFPNLQNIPIRLEEGRKIRKAFVPSEPGWSILAADYSQIELRVLAHISGDEGLTEAFTHDMDIHTKTAMDVFGVEESEVDSNMRRSAKAVNFGIVYGISDFGLSQNLNITRKEASRFIEQYFEAFKGVRKYMDDIVLEARKDGYVKTLLERRRYLPEIKASNFNLRSFAERTAMNTPIQGTAADIIKLAMVKMQERLRTDGMKSRMLLQVHDELVFEVPPEELEIMKKLVPEVMESALELNVPLKAEVSFGANWYEAK